MSETLVSISNPYEPSGRIPGSVGIAVPGTDVRYLSIFFDIFSVLGAFRQKQCDRSQRP